MAVTDKEKESIKASVFAALESKVGTWNADNIESKSPASLTDKGRLLLKESGAEEFIKNNEKKLLKYFDGIDEPFDIQEKSLEVIEQELRSDKKIKSYLFQKGAKGIKGVAEVAGIALRDVVLKHKSIQV